MFVLRSYEPEADSVSRPLGPRPVINDNQRSGGGAAVDLATVRESRDPGPTEAPAPQPVARETAPARTPAGAAMQMPLFAAAFAVRFGGANAASECPKHLADAQALIDRVGSGVDRARDRLPWDAAELVHALLDDARMLLEAARRNHEQPAGPYDHARAFAKADAALGHARAAQIVYSRWTRE